MASIHEGSCECAKSELDLLAIPYTQTSVESGKYVEYRPISSITDGAPVEFDVTASGDDYVDFLHSYLHIPAKIAKANGQALENANVVCPMTKFLYSLFYQVDI